LIAYEYIAKRQALPEYALYKAADEAVETYVTNWYKKIYAFENHSDLNDSLYIIKEKKVKIDRWLFVVIK
jgi:hypothetical protein